MKGKKLLYRILLWSVFSIFSLILLAFGSIFLFKDNIIKASIGEINKHLNTKVDISPKIELSIFDKFPQVSVKFQDVKIYESIAGSDALLGKAEKLYLTFNILTILDGKYIINQVYLENGEFNLRVTKDGENNFTILKKNTDTEGNKSQGVDLTDIHINNTLVRYIDEKLDQHYEVLSQKLKAKLTLKNNNYSISITGPQLVKSIRIKDIEYFSEKAIFIQSDLEYSDDEKTLIILPTLITIAKSDFNVKGNYSFKDANRIALTVDNEKGDAQTLLSLVPKKYADNLADYKSKGEVYFHAAIMGVISDTKSASINVKFGCKNASFYHPNLKKEIKDANFYGSFTNGERQNLETSALKIENIRFDFDEKLIQGDFLYKNFEKPYLKFDATGQANISSILSFYAIPQIKSSAGAIDFDIKFAGHLDNLKSKNGHAKIETDGEISLKNISFTLADEIHVLKNINGTFLFNKNDISFNDFTTTIGKSDFAISGLFRNAFGALFLKNGRMLANVSINGKYWDIDELIDFSFKQEEEAEKPKTDSTEKFPFLEKYIVHLEMDINKIKYKKLTMQKVKGSLSFEQPLLRTENISFQMATGNVAITSLSNFISEERIETSISASLQQLKIDSLFYIFDNFGQEFITYKNLKGEYSGTVETNLTWNKKGAIDTKSIVSNIDCSITNGALIDFKPMQNLARFIDAQELANIQFSELKNKLYIEKRMIYIPEMQILSNVSDIKVSGTHTFDNDMDYKLSVPLKNLKKPKIDKDAAFGAIEESGSNGSTLFLTIKGNSENYKFGYDTKRTKEKISEGLKKEKQELKNLFKKKEQEIQQTIKPNEEEFFEFDD